MGAASFNVVGRDRELDRIDRFLDAVPGGFSALLIEGDPGIGKSTLWDQSLARAEDRGLRVLSARPTEAERELSFTGLVDLLDTVTDAELDELPEPQRSALATALLRADSDRPVPAGAVSVAMVTATRALARAAPLLIAVDDLQWLDAPTRRVLGFTLRRLRSEPAGAILAGRDLSSIGDALGGSAGAHTTDRLELQPLSLSALYQILHGRLGVALARPDLLRVAEASAYNPLFALEIARLMAERSAVDHARPLPIPARVHDAIGERLGRLRPGTRRVLLAAAASSAPTVGDVSRAAGTGDETEQLERALEEDIIRVADGAIRFVHPLLASAVYDGAGPVEQRVMHARLAEVVGDPEERARHLALSASAPDGATARALDGAAARAKGRGATDVAARFAEQALSLTPRDDRAALLRRSLAAGDLAAAAGDHVRSRSFFERAFEEADPGAERAEAALRLAGVTELLRRRVELCDLALDEADPDGDAALLSRIHRTRGAIAYFMGDVPGAERHADLSVDLAERAGDPTALGAALGELGHWTFCGGGGVRQEMFDRAIALDRSAGGASPRTHRATVLLDSGAFEEAGEQLEALLAETMREGDLAGAAVHTFHLAELALWRGDWPLAIEHADESLLLRQHADQPSAPLYVRAMAEAHLGRVDDARGDAAAGLDDAERTEDVVFVMQNLYVLGFVELSLGDHAAAHRHLGRATDLLRPRWNREFGDCHLIPDEIESLVALGDVGPAADLVAWMADVGHRTERAWTLATGERAHALVLAAQGELDGAGEAIDRALLAHQRLPMPFELARTLLLRGDLERRRKRRAEARSTLETALETFERLGAVLWSGKARASLDRLGVRTEAQRELTPIEDRIARLASEGRTNREIAAALFVSPKTVEANLSRVYRKLGIRKRAALASAIPDDVASTSQGPAVPT